MEQENLDEFERYLKVFMWVPVKDASMVREMQNTDKFKNQHEEAAASYLKWLITGYPKVTEENKDTQRYQHLSNLLKIFKTHCPNHDIFSFLDDEL